MPSYVIDVEGRISAVPPSFASAQFSCANTSCPLTGTKRNHLLAIVESPQPFTNSVQKLPSISRSSSRLSAGGRLSLGSLVMYSSFSLPLSIYHCIK